MLIDHPDFSAWIDLQSERLAMLMETGGFRWRDDTKSPTPRAISELIRGHIQDAVLIGPNDDYGRRMIIGKILRSFSTTCGDGCKSNWIDGRVSISQGGVRIKLERYSHSFSIELSLELARQTFRD